jgi:hypothetical protein
MEEEKRTQSLPSLQIPEPEAEERVDVVVSSPVLTSSPSSDGEASQCADSIDAARMKWIHEIKQDYQGLRLAEAPGQSSTAPWCRADQDRPTARPSGTCAALRSSRTTVFPMRLAGDRVIDATTGTRCTLEGVSRLSLTVRRPGVRKAATQVF